jgi:hypothetical protein
MRAVNRIVATVVALVLIAICVVAIVEIALAALRRQPWFVQHQTIAADLAERSWSDFLVRLVLIGLALLGLLLLVAGLRRSAPSGIALDAGAANARLSVARQSLERYLAGVAAAQPGVTSSSADVGRGRATVVAGTSMRDPGELQQRVTSAVTDRLASLRLVRPLQTSVLVRRREG